MTMYQNLKNRKPRPDRRRPPGWRQREAERLKREELERLKRALRGTADQ